MTQKFFRGQRVKVADAMPAYMSHFEAGFEAIVDHSYSDVYGLGKDTDFSVLQLKDGKPVSRIAWYDESQLTLLSDDRVAGENLLQAYKAQS